ncbi:flagellar biosynthetic protein FliR, partial [Acinetobacter baumannii]
PVIIALLLTDLFFGIVNRIAPQINGVFLSLPVKMLIGILMVLLALVLLTEQFIFYFKESYKAFEQLLRAFGATM